MDDVALGFIFGLGFGIIDVLVMVPMKFPDRRRRYEAMSSAFIERFMVGFLVPNVNLGIHPAMAGFFLGALLSLPSAIMTRAYAPILGIGVIGGTIIGLIKGMIQ